MSDKSESTYVWRRINRAKLPLILDDDGDWVANPNIEAGTAAFKRMIESDMEGADWNYEEFVYHTVAAALTPGDPE